MLAITSWAIIVEASQNSQRAHENVNKQRNVATTSYKSRVLDLTYVEQIDVVDTNTRSPREMVVAHTQPHTTPSGNLRRRGVYANGLQCGTPQCSVASTKSFLLAEVALNFSQLLSAGHICVEWRYSQVDASEPSI